MEKGRDASTAGTASGSSGPMMISASPSARKICDEGKIFIEPQGMCIMAGLGLEDGKAIQALESVNKHLATSMASFCSSRPLLEYYLHLGEISSYPPGYKENAGIFCHNNPWIMIAETMVGHGDRAFDYYTGSILLREKNQRSAPLRAVCLRSDDRRQGCPDARRSQEFLADRHGRLEFYRHYPMDPGHSANLRRAID